MKQTPLFTDFSRGEISPDMMGRLDTPLFQRGARYIKNFIVTKTGAVERRNGTKWIGVVKDMTSADPPREVTAWQIESTEPGPATDGSAPDSPARDVHVFHKDDLDPIAAGAPGDVILGKSFRIYAPEASADGDKYRENLVTGIQSDNLVPINVGHVNEPPLVQSFPVGRITFLLWPEIEWNGKQRADDILAFTFDSVSTQSTTNPYTFIKDGNPGYEFPEPNVDIDGLSADGIYVRENNLLFKDGQETPADVKETLYRYTNLMQAGDLFRDSNGDVWERETPINRGSLTELQGSTLTPAAGEDWVKIVRGIYVTDNVAPDIDGRASAMAIHQNRLFIAQNGDIMRIIGSWVNQFGNFGPTLSGAGDQLVDILVPGEPGELIVWMASVGNALVVGTNRGEYVVNGALSPSTAGVQRYTSFGSEGPMFAPFYGTVLFVQSGGTAIRDFVYSNESQSYVSRDISAQAAHLFQPGITSLSIVTRPYNVVSATTRERKDLLTFTYERSTDVEAWARQEVGDGVIAAKTIELGGKTYTAMVVKRGDIYTLEALDYEPSKYQEGQVHLDMQFKVALESGDSAITEITLPSLDYVSCLPADQTGSHFARVVKNGIDLGDKRVTGQTISVGMEPGDIVIVGVPFESYLETTPIVTQSETGVGQFKKTKIDKVAMRVRDSAPFQVASKDTEWQTVILRTTDNPLQNPQPLYTGDIEQDLVSDWSEFATIRVKTDGPLPLAFSAIMPTVEVYE